jgi:hypothetical protein
MKKSSHKGNRSGGGDFFKGCTRLFSYLHNNVMTVNSSKLFAGIVVITLNIASRFVNLKLSKSMESYLKFTFSRNALVFCMVWMGSRDIYIALSVMLVFILCMDYLFNEDSKFCILPEHFMDYHINLLENNNGSPPSDDEIKSAKTILERVCSNVKSQDDTELCNTVISESGRLFSNYSYKKNLSNGGTTGNLPMIGGGPHGQQGQGENNENQRELDQERDDLEGASESIIISKDVVNQ